MLSANPANGGKRPFTRRRCPHADLASEYKLRRVVEDWAVQPGDGFLYFTLRPPWVHTATTDAFFTLHPEQRKHALAPLRASRTGRRQPTAADAARGDAPPTSPYL